MRNVKLIYLLSFLFESWFWFGIWIFYYLRFTNYAGIGLIESAMIITKFLAEIPTGALADLFGKKIVIITAFFIAGLGYLIEGLTSSFPILVLSVILQTLGGSFYSGSHEALLYDSLNTNQQSEKFSRVITHTRSFKLIAHALTGIIGGLVYVFNPRLPFFLSASTCLIGFVISLFLYQPKAVEKVMFNLSSLISQSKKGLQELFTAPVLKTYIGVYLIVGFFVAIMYEILDDSLMVAYHFKPNELAFAWAIVSIIVAYISQITPFFIKRFHSRKGIFIIGLAMVPLLLIAPYVTFIVGATFVTIRIIAQVIYDNMSLIVINQNVQSKFRATAISSFVILKNIPYVFSAFFIGNLIDQWGAPRFAFNLGLVLLLCILIYYLLTGFRKPSHIRV